MKALDELVIVDLETTGIDPVHDRITEVAIIRVRDGQEISRWSSLVNPGVSIPAEIQALTGISNAMVRTAPSWEQLAPQVLERLKGAIFVAHNARFDYGFVKQGFARSGQTFSADVLCTVRLSRRLDPEHSKHGLDVLVERHGLFSEQRHRAMGDAELVQQLLTKFRTNFGDEVFLAACRRLLKTPSLPPQLAPDALDAIPDAPGVYVFYGVNELPIYIGKSVSLRERVRSHFSNDYRTANDTRLSAELRRIETHVCAGEFGALLLEARWIGEKYPALNRALRKNDQWQLLDRDAEISPLSECPVEELQNYFGPFSSKRSAKAILQGLASEHRLCWTALALEKREGACFGYQVRKCAGLCMGLESHASHWERLEQGLQAWSIPAWPFNGGRAIAAVVEESALTGRHVHLFKHWCYMGSISSTPSSFENTPVGFSPFAHERYDPNTESNPLQFDPYIYRLLHKAWTQGSLLAF